MSDKEIIDEHNTLENNDSVQNIMSSAQSKQQNPHSEEEIHSKTHIIANGPSLIETETDISAKINDKSISQDNVGFYHSQTHTSSFSGATSSFKRAQGMPNELLDANSIIEKMDDPKEIVKACENYQPKSRDFDIEALKKSERTKIKKYKGSLYFGEFINGKRHGRGIMIYNPLRIYEGDWENDLKHGKGLEILGNGSRYEGEYLNGKPEGYGQFLWANGEFYEGEWKNGLKHGSGMWRGLKGEYYFGEWKNGKAEGYGVHTWRNGDKYEGELKGFLKHGHGTEKFVNGDYYVGTYANGKPDGYGEYYWANGCHYKGDFKNGLRHGKGVWTKGKGNGDIYEGEWINDKKCGKGVYRWASGNHYHGNYFDDMRHGYGEMYWIDGSAYKGIWERGIQHGEGQLIIPGKGVKKGMFENNVFMDEIIGETGSQAFGEIGNNVLRRVSNGPSNLPRPGGKEKLNPQIKTRGNSRDIGVHNNDSSFNNENGLPEIIKPTKPSNLRSQTSSKANSRISSALDRRKNVKTDAVQQGIAYKGVIKHLPHQLNDLNETEGYQQIRKVTHSTRGRSIDRY